MRVKTRWRLLHWEVCPESQGAKLELSGSLSKSAPQAMLAGSRNGIASYKMVGTRDLGISQTSFSLGAPAI